MATKYIAAKEIVGGVAGCLDNVNVVTESLVAGETIAIVKTPTGACEFSLAISSVTVDNITVVTALGNTALRWIMRSTTRGKGRLQNLVSNSAMSVGYGISNSIAGTDFNITAINSGVCTCADTSALRVGTLLTLLLYQSAITYDSLTPTIGSNLITDASQSWPVDGMIGFQVLNPYGTWNLIKDNTATTLTIFGTYTTPGSATYNIGGIFEIASIDSSTQFTLTNTIVNCGTLTFSAAVSKLRYPWFPAFNVSTEYVYKIQGYPTEHKGTHGLQLTRAGGTTDITIDLKLAELIPTTSNSDSINRYAGSIITGGCWIYCPPGNTGTTTLKITDVITTRSVVCTSGLNYYNLTLDVSDNCTTFRFYIEQTSRIASDYFTVSSVMVAETDMLSPSDYTPKVNDFVDCMSGDSPGIDLRDFNWNSYAEDYVNRELRIPEQTSYGVPTGSKAVMLDYHTGTQLNGTSAPINMSVSGTAVVVGANAVMCVTNKTSPGKSYPNVTVFPGQSWATKPTPQVAYLDKDTLLFNNITGIGAPNTHNTQICAILILGVYL